MTKNGNAMVPEKSDIEKEQYFGLFRQIARMPIGIEHSSYYDGVFSAVYDHYSYPLSWEIDFYTSVIPSRDSHILEIGCGSGRMTIPLLSKGCTAPKTILSRKMISGAMNAVPLRLKCWDTAI